MNTKTHSLSATRLLPALLASLLLLGGCSHQIAIGPLDTPKRVETSLNAKKAAYVMTDIDRAKQVHSEGGGGDKINYFPYRDLEKSIRDAMRAVYSDVIVVKSASDVETIKASNISFIFTPDIVTTSSSSSLLTWPPTQFTVTLSCVVVDANGKEVTRFKVSGEGKAEFSEFKNDFGLAGRRAATDVSEKLKQAIQANALLN